MDFSYKPSSEGTEIKTTYTTNEKVYLDATCEFILKKILMSLKFYLNSYVVSYERCS